MILQIDNLDDFLAMLGTNAAQQALAEKNLPRVATFMAGLEESQENGVDDEFTLFYAQCRLINYDKGHIQ